MQGDCPGTQPACPVVRGRGRLRVLLFLSSPPCPSHVHSGSYGMDLLKWVMRTQSEGPFRSFPGIPVSRG